MFYIYFLSQYNIEIVKKKWNLNFLNYPCSKTVQKKRAKQSFKENNTEKNVF